MGCQVWPKDADQSCELLSHHVSTLRRTLWCRHVTEGMDVMHAMEAVETRKEGIFVMPKERITIFSTFVYLIADPQNTLGIIRVRAQCF